MRKNDMLQNARFNPTVVRLKDLLTGQTRHDLNRFNPTVVRLKAGPSRPFRLGSPEFQSHCGAIKRLRASSPQSPLSAVSIPLWCD